MPSPSRAQTSPSKARPRYGSPHRRSPDKGAKSTGWARVPSRSPSPGSRPQTTPAHDDAFFFLNGFRDGYEVLGNGSGGSVSLPYLTRVRPAGGIPAGLSPKTKVTPFFDRMKYQAEIDALPEVDPLIRTHPKGCRMHPDTIEEQSHADMQELDRFEQRLQDRKDAKMSAALAAEEYELNLKVQLEGVLLGSAQLDFSPSKKWGSISSQFSSKDPKNFPMEGVPLSFLREFLDEAKQQAEEQKQAVRGGVGKTARAYRPSVFDAREFDLIDMTTKEAVARLIKPATAKDQCSYVDQRKTEGLPVARATVFISHCWQYKLLDLISAVLHLEESLEHPEDCYVWIDIFSINQHQTEPREICGAVMQCIKSIGFLVVVFAGSMNDPAVVHRSWPIFEMFAAMQPGQRSKFQVKMAPDTWGDFHSAAIGNEFDWRSWCTSVALEGAHASVPTDRDVIRQYINKTVGFDQCNRTVLEGLRRWMVRTFQDMLTSIPTDDRVSCGLVPLLGELFLEQGKLIEADQHIRETLEVRRRTLSVGHKDTQWCFRKLEILSERFIEKEEHLRDVVGQMRAQLANPPDTPPKSPHGRGGKINHTTEKAVAAMNELASLLKHLGQLQEAQELYEERMRLCGEAKGEQHLETVKSMVALAAVLRARKMFKRAEPLLRNALASRTNRLKDGEALDSATVENMSALAHTLKEQDQCSEAVELFRKVVDETRQKLGEFNPKYAQALYDLAVALMAESPRPDSPEEDWRAANTRRSALKEVEHLLRLAVHTSRENPKGDPVAMYRYINTLAMVLCEKDETPPETLPLAQEALDGRRKLLGNDTLDTVESIGTVAEILLQQGDAKESAHMFREVLTKEGLLGKDHPEITKANKGLEKCRFHQVKKKYLS